MPSPLSTAILIRTCCSRLANTSRGTRGNNYRGIHFFVDNLSLHGIWEIDIPRDFTTRERKPRENKRFHGNRLDGNGQSIFPREPLVWDHEHDIFTGTGINPNYREILRDFSREFSRGLPCKNLKRLND